MEMDPLLTLLPGSGLKSQGEGRLQKDSGAVPKGTTAIIVQAPWSAPLVHPWSWVRWRRKPNLIAHGEKAIARPTVVHDPLVGTPNNLCLPIPPLVGMANFLLQDIPCELFELLLQQRKQ